MQPDEEQIFDQINATLLDISGKVGARQRHTVRSVHAKSHGLLKAELEVLRGLSEPLRQGLFSTPGRYDAIMRFSTNPGDILSDHISTPRGLAVKILGVEAERHPSHEGHTTQDFVFNNSRVFHAAHAKAFLSGIQLLDKHANDSEAAKQVVSSTSQLAEEALELVGGSSAVLKGFGASPTEPLGETYFTAVPLRYGDYFGKLQLVPVSESLVSLRGKHPKNPRAWNSLRDSIAEFFENQTAIWELRVQLCTDPARMPVEDASVEWDEELSPYLPIARLTAVPQDSYSDARRVYVDEHLSFNPWHCLSAHRPLGNLMRARFKAYQASSFYRHQAEGRDMIEPRSIGELPA